MSLDSEAITQIREYVCDECDLVRSIVDKLSVDAKGRYIRTMIYNILEFCVNLLDEGDGYQMLQQIQESLQQSLSNRLNADKQS
jgi:hypothetical protein